MDEPQLTNPIDETDQNPEKSYEETLVPISDGNELEKPMDVDDNVAQSDQPSTSSEHLVESTELVDVSQQDVSMPETSESLNEPVDQTIEQVNFENPAYSLDDTVQTTPDLDETAQSVNDTLNFTEKSINISQINVGLNDDDSNDAFNALKESEVDALHTPKEEIEEPKESPEGEVESEFKEPESQGTETINIDDESAIETPVETDNAEKSTTEDKPDEEPTPSTSTDIPDTSETFDNENTESVEKPDGEKQDDVEEILEDETTETTTEGEGIDENVCLLGDAEREITDADKERAVQPSIEEEETEAESPLVDKDSTIEATADEIMEVDSETVEKEPEEPEIIEVEESIDQPVIPLKENEIREISDELTEQVCLNCENSAKCMYQLLEESGEVKYLCTYNCVKEHRDDNPDKYTLTQKKIYIHQVPASEQTCSKCAESKMCRFRYRIKITKAVQKEIPAPIEGETPDESQQPITETIQCSETQFLCDDKCLDEYVNTNAEKFIVKRKRSIIKEIDETEEDLKCIECQESKKCKYKFTHDGEEDPSYICNEECLNLLVDKNPENFTVTRRSVRVRELPKRQPTEEQEIPKIIARTDAEAEAAKSDRDRSFLRRCAQCSELVDFTSRAIQWETFDFCDEKCLGTYQNLIGATCTTCNTTVALASIGKFCVRFGFDIKQFCSSACLDVYKKALKQCTLCLRDLVGETDIVLAQVGEKKLYKDFCNQTCLKRFEEIVNPKKKQLPYLCSVCNNKKPTKIEVFLDDNIHRFCSNPCFSAFKFVNNVAPDECDMCARHFERKSNETYTIYEGTTPKIFCTKSCMNVFISTHREIWQCNWCKVSKYNYDMVQVNFGKNRMCSVNCLTLYEVSINALSKKRSKCSHCKLIKQPQYHLTMSDASIRNFCTYQCVLGFQSQFSKRGLGDGPSVVPAGTAKRIKPATSFDHQQAAGSVPVISLVQSLNSRRGPSRTPYNPIANRSHSPIPVPELTVQLERLSDVPSRVKVSSFGGTSSYAPLPSTSRSVSPMRVEHKTQVVTIPPLPKQICNKSTLCKSIMLNKGINCIVTTAEAECQTEDWLEQKVIIPVPIPIFIPQPMYMYNMPTPIPVPIPLPIPVPVFVPTTRNSAQGIMKEIKKIQEKMPTDPYEAELLMMAEMVAGDKKREATDSDSDEDANNELEYGDGIENNSSFNEDLVQMAFKMASGNDFDDPPVDLENEMTANTISQNSHPYGGGDDMDPHSLHHHQLLLLQQQREAAAAAAAIQQRGRKRIQPPKQNNNNRNSAPNKRIKREMEVMQPEIPREPAEKPDANMCLKYTFGVNAWKQWVATKNADFEKSSIRRKPIKSEILQLTADELNYSLCMFVKEVRKPNGSEYAPDTIYYLVLGIQQYLYENGRIDNIFTDRYYEQFTDCLDEVAKKFSVLYNDSQYIVTRVEEEHLWECKQLGAHSPHVLLSTLMFFNTKHFNLVTVDEHMELSFSHIMKHWKRNPNQPGAAKMPGSRNVLLRFYPPQSSLEANSRKKKVYEQQENEENPLRCPVKLYEFYLSKCPESVKTRNDVFYLQPERSCVPDSPVWYSTQPLSRDALSKMLHRVKMVKEINIALLTS